MKIVEEFREFAVKGNVVDLAVAVIIGGAFGKIVTSFTNDVMLPPIGLLLGKVDFSNLFLNLSGTPYASVADAKQAGAPTVNYGIFLNQVLDFVIVAFVLFLLIRQMNRLMKPAAAPPEAPSTKECPECASSIAIKAKRCTQCTAQLVAA